MDGDDNNDDIGTVTKVFVCVCVSLKALCT